MTINFQWEILTNIFLFVQLNILSCSLIGSFLMVLVPDTFLHSGLKYIVLTSVRHSTDTTYIKVINTGPFNATGNYTPITHATYTPHICNTHSLHMHHTLIIRVSHAHHTCITRPSLKHHILITHTHHTCTHSSHMQHTLLTYATHTHFICITHS